MSHTPDICCIGHITLDKIVTPRHTVHMPGGTSFYFAHGISSLDPTDFLLVTSLADSEMQAVNDIQAKGVKVKVLPSPHSVYFENKYGEDQNHRTQRVLAKAAPFTIDGLRDVDAKIFHLGTLLSDDFSLDVIKYLSTKGIISVDVQGIAFSFLILTKRFIIEISASRLPNGVISLTLAFPFMIIRFE